VQYKLPLGAVGELVAGGFVASDVAKIFRYRTDIIAQMTPEKLAATPP
jgi:hypothetical protein